MKPLRILHFEDDPTAALLVRRAIERSGFDARITLVQQESEYVRAMERGEVDVILVDSGLPGFSGQEALEIAKRRVPEVPFIFVSGAAEEKQALASLEAGASDFILKGQLWQLGVALRRITGGRRSRSAARPAGEGMGKPRRLVKAVQDLSLARTLEKVMEVALDAARKLTGADGATFVLRENGMCHHAAESGIAELWKGRRFPMSACISGWAMAHRQPAVIEDVHNDERVQADLYRSTFVKSLVLAHIGPEEPVGAIGGYWAKRHRASEAEVELLQALANATAAAMENVQLISDLERRVRARTLQLEASNQELEAFSYSVSHDLRTPLSNVSALAELMDMDTAGQARKEKRYTERMKGEVRRMSALIDDLLRLAKVARLELRREPVNLSEMAVEIGEQLRLRHPERKVEFRVQEGAVVNGDAGLLRVVMENLFSNAWKYSAKRERTVIEFGRETKGGEAAHFVKDNGAGFDMKSAEQLFIPFRRLHKETEFAGHGVGLATVQRVIHRHGGRVWAEAEAGKGATFYFTLPDDF
jgi:signal transduction histidine kinase/ActR/RegA family two-component response regulator